MTRRLASLIPVALSLLLVACGGAMPQHMSSKAMPAAAPAAPVPLDRSLFARSPDGQLSEDALQTILASPIELDLPSRVGVMPIITATDWRGPSPDFEQVPAGLAPLVTRLRKDGAFSLVTEMMPIPSGSLGMESLREAAARYRLRYVMLYREVLTKRHSLNAWAWGYSTVVGALFLPGQDQEVYGYLEVTMFDVKTGLLMFTTRRAITASQRANSWNTDRKLDQLAADAAARFSPELATDALADVRRFAAAAVAENEQRGAAPGGLVHVPPPGGPMVATDPPK